MNRFLISKMLPEHKNCCVAIIGLGYVGLPLAFEIAKSQLNGELGNGFIQLIGFDVNNQRLQELIDLHDRTCELTSDELKRVKAINYTCNENDLDAADVFIVTVPTPIDDSKKPDLKPLKSASTIVGKSINRRHNKKESAPIVIYESTVYPGATEEICVPLLEKHSGLKYNIDFFCGYSPERINPGDKNHRLTTITKVTSGSNIQTKKWISTFYSQFVKAGVHETNSIKVAEAAKVIENTQRDLNIALINELSIIFKKMNIDTIEVLEAAGSKWNFLPFRPGLVGGHCIGIDPYYLTYQAERLGYYPQVVLAGRRINDFMPQWIVEQLVKHVARRRIPISGSEVLILGATFKENCPDLRNSKVIDLVRELDSYGFVPNIVDPCIDPKDANSISNIEISLKIRPASKYRIVIVAVCHDEFKNFSLTDWSNILDESSIIYDLKGIVPAELNAVRL
jgi:UDP-N-acetyl-D-galactosamine dehydrogenase